MNFIDYLIITLSFISFPLINQAILAFFGDLHKLHSESDLFRDKLQQHLILLDKTFYSRWLPPFVLSILGCLFWPFLQWEILDPSRSLQIFVAIICAILCWKGISLDYDLVTLHPTRLNRLLFLASLLGVIFYPGLLIFFLFIAIHMMRSWYHHQLMAIRILQMFVSFLIMAGVVNTIQYFFNSVTPPHTAVPIFLILWVIAAHYFYSGVAKLYLGRHWFSWAWENRIHYLALSAYMWGWMRSQDAKQRIQWIQAIAPFDRILQFGALIYECGWILSCFHAWIAEALCLFGGIFHSLVFLLTGIFFWQSILVLFAFYCLLATLPSETSIQLFTIWNGGFFTFLLLIARQKLWVPQKLAWWDAPFEGRVHWYVLGKSGKRYGLYNDFMDPHERFFGRHTPFFLIPTKMFHGHLGEVDSLELRDAIIATKGDPAKIDKLRAKYGYYVHHPVQDKVHDQYIKTFFKKFNAGELKNAFPKFLKAPGGQFYYWGNLPPFTGQEPVEQVLLFFKEEFYTGSEIIVVREELIKAIQI